MSSPDTLSSLLAECLAGKGAIPLSISVKEDEEVQRLREEVSELQARNCTLQIDLDRAQYLFRCESILNNQLVDLCRQHGIKLDSAFFQRPYSDGT